MAVQTKYLGEIDIEEAHVVDFPAGLPGFTDEVSFVLLDLPGNPVFQTLQSIETTELAFIVTNPYHFYKDYEFKLDDQIQESLEIKTEADVIVLSTVTLKDPFDTSTLNLKAPIIINSTSKLGKQYILNNDEYLTKAPIVLPDASEAKGE